MKNKHEVGATLSRERWLELALQVMVENCISKFNLDSLLKGMPVTKGSFYNHFKNRTDFLVALVGYWDRHDTKTVVDALKAMPDDFSPQDKLWEMMCEIYELGFTKHELLIRSLSLEFPEIAEAIKTVDSRRLETVGKLFAEMGFHGDDLEMRTLAFVTTMSQDGNVFKEISTEAYERQLRLRFKFFIRP